MTTNKDDNSFPQAYYNSEDLNLETGLTKREYFAARALQGLLSGNKILMTAIPYQAVKLADELIKELNESKIHRE